MRIFKNITILASVLLAFVSCDIADPIESGITHYPELELLGEETMLVEKGSTFEDPGISATIQGEEVPYETKGEIDTSVPGIYQLTYEAANEDGFAARIGRVVVVYENNGSVAGFWHGSSSSSAENPILITTTEDPNVFEITDILAGHYEYGRSYGPVYAAPSTITVADGSVSSPGGVNGFGMWTVSGPTISSDQRTMTWAATLVDAGFTLTGLTFEKITP